MNGLTVVDGDRQFSPEIYNRMRQAIAECASIDDCQKAQSAAAAMATYYHQIHDHEARQRMDEIRLRAWRRMSEIIATVDVSKCPTQRKMVETVRAKLGEAATKMLTDSRIIQLIKLAGVPDHGFEAAVKKCGNSIDAMIREAHPASIEERNRAKESKKRWEEEALKRAKEESRAAAEAEKMRAKEEAEAAKRADAVIDMVKKSAIMEAEVGLTLSPKAKAHLVEFKVMMDRKMHDQLRDAAHERRTTMWAILREASNYWFVVNGYDKV